MEKKMETIGVIQGSYSILYYRVYELPGRPFYSGYYPPQNGESNGKEHGKLNGNWDYVGYRLRVIYMEKMNVIHSATSPT